VSENEIRGSFGVLRAEAEMIDVSSGLPRPDPEWTYTDHAGHDHHREGNGYPTLVVVTEEPYWCPDCHEEHTDSHYECPLCGEEIAPGLVSAPLHREYTPGLTHYYLNDEPISPDEYQWLVAQLQRETGGTP
jgi:hypothetical protein